MFLLDEFFINLEKNDRIEYRKLRENYKIIESKSLQILTLQQEIRKKQQLVQKLKKQISPSKSKDSYLYKMNSVDYKEILELGGDGVGSSIRITISIYKTNGLVQ